MLEKLIPLGSLTLVVQLKYDSMEDFLNENILKTFIRLFRNTASIAI